MMNKRSQLSIAFDVLGISSLVAATGCLAMFFWTPDTASQALALKGFTPAFSMMLLFFALGRLTEFFELAHAEPVVERRGREATVPATQPAAANSVMATTAFPKPLKLHLVELSEGAPAPVKTRRDAA